MYSLTRRMYCWHHTVIGRESEEGPRKDLLIFSFVKGIEGKFADQRSVNVEIRWHLIINVTEKKKPWQSRWLIFMSGPLCQALFNFREMRLGHVAPFSCDERVVSGTGQMGTPMCINKTQLGETQRPAEY